MKQFYKNHRAIEAARELKKLSHQDYLEAILLSEGYCFKTKKEANEFFKVFMHRDDIPGVLECRELVLESCRANDKEITNALEKSKTKIIRIDFAEELQTPCQLLKTDAPKENIKQIYDEFYTLESDERHEEIERDGEIGYIIDSLLKMGYIAELVVEEETFIWR